jgi:hypothetical protein
MTNPHFLRVNKYNHYYFSIQKENSPKKIRYFLYGLSKTKVKLEFDRFLFFETCRSLKLLGQLKIDKSEINNFLDEIKRGTKKGTEN